MSPLPASASTLSLAALGGRRSRAIAVPPLPATPSPLEAAASSPSSREIAPSAKLPDNPTLQGRPTYDYHQAIATWLDSLMQSAPPSPRLMQAPDYLRAYRPRLTALRIALLTLAERMSAEEAMREIPAVDGSASEQGDAGETLRATLEATKMQTEARFNAEADKLAQQIKAYSQQMRDLAIQRGKNAEAAATQSTENRRLETDKQTAAEKIIASNCMRCWPCVEAEAKQALADSRARILQLPNLQRYEIPTPEEEQLKTTSEDTLRRQLELIDERRKALDLLDAQMTQALTMRETSGVNLGALKSCYYAEVSRELMRLLLVVQAHLTQFLAAVRAHTTIASVERAFFTTLSQQLSAVEHTASLSFGTFTCPMANDIFGFQAWQRFTALDREQQMQVMTNTASDDTINYLLPEGQGARAAALRQGRVAIMPSSSTLAL